MRPKEAPSYSSSRVQRATRINSIEAARLEQTLQYLEKAKLHQCRLSNQDIRVISLSLDYIQMSSGHSKEAWRPPVVNKPMLSLVLSDDEDDSDRLDAHVKTEEDAEDDQTDTSPFFLYGERIWERKRRRIQRPMSAAPSSRRNGIMDNAISSLASDAGSSTMSQRPKSSPGKHQISLPTEIQCYPSHDISLIEDGGFSGDHDATFITRGSGWATLRKNDFDDPSIVLSTGLSRASTPRGRVIPHQDWEDDTSHVTKKILKSQALAQKGRQQQSLYKAPGEMMTSSAARNVRGLARQIRVSASAAIPDQDQKTRSQGANGTGARHDFPPTRPSHHTQDGYNRRATIGEIVNQRRPTLSAGAWKSHLGQTSEAPMSLAARRQKVLESKKELNENRNQWLTDRVKDFVATPNSQLLLGSKTVCI